MDDGEFLAAFEAGRLRSFTHRDHLRMAFAYSRRGGAERAVAGAREGIGRLARGTSKYHDTLTVAWARAVAHMAAESRATTFDAFLAQHPQLERRDLMNAHYSRERLFSAAARARFVEPDRAPLPD
jgi:hypothetical protein